jgi:hypothetical protein
MKREELVVTTGSISEGEIGGIYWIPISGWNLKDEKKLIIELMEEHFDYKLKGVEILKKTEEAYSCQRFMDGLDANDEGFSHFVDFHKNWRKGLGKCTQFKVKFAFCEVDDE